MKPAYRLRIKNKPQLLVAMMRALASHDTRISFEGQLARTALVNLDGARFDETEVLRRGTQQPRLDFVVLPLTPASLPLVEKAVISKIACSGSAGIVHVQIETHGAIAFAAYDNFDPECVVAYSPVPVGLLTELVENHVLHSWEAV